MDDKKVKILAYYLPQFHEIPENNKWWGKGFTEWNNVKKAKAFFEGHEQPRVPLDSNYYNLENVEVMKWQAEIAKEHGLYGFCFYHYWFYEKPLLEKPLENYLNEVSIDFPYCFCWANESWTNGWAKAECSVIMEQKYGNKDEWKKHFEYLLPYFKDKRYIKEDNEPLLVIYRPYLYERMMEMLDYWKLLAIENGFSGIKVASQRFENPEDYQILYEYLDYHIAYEPDAPKTYREKETIWRKVRAKVRDFMLEKFNKDISIHQTFSGPVKYDYDELWSNVIRKVAKDDKDIAGAFVNWDNTPRHSRRGTVLVNVSPEKFGAYMKMQIQNVKRNYANKYLFLFAWNEWGEGGIMEPDEVYKYKYLEEMKKAMYDTE